MEGKVAQILSNERIVINQGSRNGFEVGDIVEVFELGEEILDPDTEESLGNLEIIKGQFIVISVQKKMCIAEIKKTTITRTKYVDSFGTSGILGHRKESYDVTVKEDVNLAETKSSYQEKLTIQLGDIVRVVRD